MNRRRRRPNYFGWVIFGLVVLFGYYFNQVYLPSTPLLAGPTPTETRSPEAYKTEAEQDLYGLNTDNVRPPSILHQIRTCKHPRQLEYMVNWVGRNIDYEPSRRWYRQFVRAVAAKEKELGCRVMWTEDEVSRGTAHGG